MIKFVNKYSDQINGYLFVLPAFLIIGLFGIFPVFFGMYMSVHKWKVFKGRFLGFENYQKIVGDIGSFWIFILGFFPYTVNGGLEQKSEILHLGVFVNVIHHAILQNYGARTIS